MTIIMLMKIFYTDINIIYRMKWNWIKKMKIYNFNNKIILLLILILLLQLIKHNKMVIL